MKCPYLMLVSLLVPGSLILAQRCDPPAYAIPYLDGITIDGNRSDWKNAGFVVDLPASKEGSTRAPEDFDVTVRLGWDKQGLLVAAEIHDDRFVEHENIDRLWSRDCIEMFVAPTRGDKSVLQAVIAPGMDPRFPEVRSQFHDFRITRQTTGHAPTLETARTSIDNGYRVEIRFPWKNIGIAPVTGAEVGFQIYVNDADDPQAGFDELFKAIWFPRDDTHLNTESMHRLRLARTPSPPVRCAVRARYDTFWRVAVHAAASAEFAGTTARIVESDTTIGEVTFEPAEAGHRSEAATMLPAPPVGTAYRTICVIVDGTTIGHGMLDNTEYLRAKEFVWMDPVVNPSVFSSTAFPNVTFPEPFRARALIGEYTIETDFYNAEYTRVDRADTPGRYGAVITITAADGTKHKRFRTIYRLPGNGDVVRRGFDARIAFPRVPGLDSSAFERFPHAQSDYVRSLLRRDIEGHGQTAVMLAGLSEFDPSREEAGFFTNPLRKDRQWWVNLKRTLYGYETRYPDSLMRPVKMKGTPAPVVREGSLEEAGMKADAPRKIDTVLKEWAAETDEAFAVCVVRNGVIVLHKAYGTRDGAPMTVDTKSWMASTTKMLSGILVMMHVDQGLIDLDDPLDKHLPQFEDIETNTPVTIRHCYTHTAGTEGHWIDFRGDLEERIVRLFPFYKVGRRYAYNGTGMELVCAILENMSGESLPNLYKNHLFDPLGCSHTTATTASYDGRSVPLDMARIAQMMLNRGAYGDRRFFGEKTFEKMLPRKLTKTLAEDVSKEYGIGLTWIPNYPLGEGAFTHGAASGATTFISPRYNLLICMTRNALGRNFDEYHPRFIEAVLDGLVQ